MTTDWGTAAEALKNARQEKNLSLERVHQRTRIPLKALEALENNNPAFFEAEVYRHGFFIQYCEYLELDPETFAQKVISEDPQPVPKQEPAETVYTEQEYGHAESRNHDKPEFLISRPSPMDEASLTQTWGPSLIKFTAGAALFMMFCSVWVWRNASPKRWDNNFQISSSMGRLYETAFVSNLKASFEKRAWARIKADDKVVFEGYAPEGITREWKASKNFEVELKTPDTVRLLLDNKSIKQEAFRSGHAVIPVTFSDFAY